MEASIGFLHNYRQKIKSGAQISVTGSGWGWWIQETLEYVEGEEQSPRGRTPGLL